MIDLFQKIPTALPKPVRYIQKRQMTLTDKGGKWLTETNKYHPPHPPMKTPRLKKSEKNN